MVSETYSHVAPECPYCHHIHDHDGGFFYDESLAEYECESCGVTFDMQVYTSTSWTCSPQEPAIRQKGSDHAG